MAAHSKVNVSRAGSTAQGSRAREVAGVVLLAIGVFLTLALISLQVGDGRLMGPLGRVCARAVYALAGIGAYLVCAALVVVPVRMLLGRPAVTGLTEAPGALLGMSSIGVLLHLTFGDYRLEGHGPGGMLGEYLAEVLRAAVSTAGTALVALVGLTLAAIATTPLEAAHVARALVTAGRCAWRGLRVAAIETVRLLGVVVRAILPERDGEADLEDEEEEDGEGETDDAAPAAALDGDTVRVGAPAIDPIIVEPKSRRRQRKAEAAADPAADEAAAPAPVVDEKTIATPVSPAASEAAEAAGARAEPVIVEPGFRVQRKDMKEREKKAEESRPDYIPIGDKAYQLPPVSLLRYDDTSVSFDHDSMKEMAARLVTALETYGIRGEVTRIRPGPVVTTYEFAPAPGTRVSKISSLADDLTMALEALSVRIVAPIPGRGVVGIEVPNKQRETVFLKEIIADDVFLKGKSKLSLALGKDSEGCPVAVDLAKMPHLLVAGTTGAGKSVSLNAMIASILYKATPEEVRFIMVDPKMLELSVYEGIPHLLLPVVTDPRKANLALKWAVEEMERRYQCMAELGVKDIGSFNRKVDKRGADPVTVTIEDEHGVAIETATVESVTDEEIAAGAVGEQLVLPVKSRPGPLKKLPYVVIVIDEFADLMMTAAKEVEHSVTRIAQKARAAGIHLLLATQRPTTEVITGLIKANFPSRIAFKVTSKINSMAILETPGAEALLGHGDMLFSDRGLQLRRVHGCLVQDEEIQTIVDFLKKQAKPVYDLDILRPRDEDGEGGGEGGGDDEEGHDDMYERALQLVIETRQASISMIQRRLRVGYNRAARMVERMERQGVVGPPDVTNRREVLVQAIAAAG